MKNLRLLVQSSFTIITNGYFLGFLKGKIYRGNLKKICFPGLNCYSCPGALGSCPIGSLQGLISSPEYKISFYVLGFLLLFGSIFGRLICGWLCPFGLVQDIIYKIPLFKKIKNLPYNNILKYLKYIILVTFVILLPMYVVDIIGQGDPWFCKYICPSGTLFAGIPLVIGNKDLRPLIGKIFIWKNTILFFTVILSIKVYRPFCKYICPLGAIYSIFNPISLFRYNIDDKKCIDCNACKDICPMDIQTNKVPNSLECIRCGKCKDICPKSAISFIIQK